MIMKQTLLGSNVARHGNITARFVLVTPEMAADWLSTVNDQNRDIRKSHAEELTRKISLGRYKINSTGIAFDSNGILIDGQHRLTAVRESGVSITMLVIEGLDPMARAGQDIGISRGPRDLLKLIAGEEDSRFVAGAINAIRSGAFNSNSKQDWEDLNSDYERYAVGIEWSKSVAWTKKFRNSAVSGALIFAYTTLPDLVRIVHAELESGNVDPGAPATLTLRDMIMSTGINGGHERSEIFGKILSTVWHRHHGRNPKKIYETAAAVEFFAKAYA